jgi:small subunit ribosomal protein S17
VSVLLPHDARRRTKVGTVVSDKMDKTVVVAVENLKRHRLYGRSMRRTKKYHAHDEDNRCKIGDKVVIAESRPLSKTKRWRVREIVGHDVVAGLPKVDESGIAAPPPKIDPSTIPPTPPRPRAAADEGDGASGVADEVASETEEGDGGER